MRPWRLRDRTRSMTDSARRRGRSHQWRTALPHVGARRLQHPPPGNRETLVGHPLRLAPAMEQQATDKPVPAFPPKRAKAPGIRRVRARGSLDVDAQIDSGAGTSAIRWRDQALKAGCRHRASPCLRSSCSKALAIRSISAAPAGRFRGAAPDRGYGRDFLDDRASLRQRERPTVPRHRVPREHRRSWVPLCRSDR